MKNTLKKVISIILAAVLLCAPVAVVAENVEDAWDVGENYVYYGQYLEVGAADYTLSELYDYTILAFAPSEVGNYTFDSSNALIGIVSYHGMWITIQPDANTITENTASWECTSVGQEIWLAVTSDSAAASIEITKGASQTIIIEKIVYENKTTPVPFTFTGDSAELLNVSTANSTVDTAVLGADGYYHLNSANGYILYANLSDTKMSLYAASQTGQLKSAIYNDEGQAIAINDYNEAFLAYYDCVDSATQLYPLTEDLITMFREVGNHLSWYGTEGWIGGTKDDAWMFACYYVKTANYTVTIDGVETQVAAGTELQLSTDAFLAENGRYYRFSEWTGDVADVADVKAATTTVVVNSDLVINSVKYVIGDVNGDNNLNGMDSNTMKRMVVGNLEVVDSGDANGDGKVQTIDANLLARMLAGTWFPEA
ncbi:MAG: dockerin type I repeat-containing protein [Clostridia bacterium]|nr:dockerin type I repeat-containing protein [Clostridia bacterium]